MTQQTCNNTTPTKPAYLLLHTTPPHYSSHISFFTVHNKSYQNPSVLLLPLLLLSSSSSPFVVINVVWVQWLAAVDDLLASSSLRVWWSVVPTLVDLRGGEEGD